MLSGFSEFGGTSEDEKKAKKERENNPIGTFCDMDPEVSIGPASDCFIRMMHAEP
jgi:hypothetical protein